MTPATILHEAEVELWEAVAYYEDKAAGLGLDFEAEVERSVLSIRESPERRLSVKTVRGDTSCIAFLSWSTPFMTTISGSLPSHTAEEGPGTGQIVSRWKNRTAEREDETAAPLFPLTGDEL